MARSSERTLPVEKPKRKLDIVNSFSPSPHSPQAHAVPRSIHITRNLTGGERALAGSGFTSKASVRAAEADSSAEPARGRPVPSNTALPPTTSLQNKSSSGRHRLPETPLLAGGRGPNARPRHTAPRRLRGPGPGPGGPTPPRRGGPGPSDNGALGLLRLARPGRPSFPTGAQRASRRPSPPVPAGRPQPGQPRLACTHYSGFMLDMSLQLPPPPPPLLTQPPPRLSAPRVMEGKE